MPTIHHLLNIDINAAHFNIRNLTLIWVGILGIRLAVMVRRGESKISPCSKLVKIMLETWNLVCMYTRICSFRKFTLSTKISLICKKLAFFVKTINMHNPVDTGRKLNVHKTFRRRPGRLLNVLYTSCVYWEVHIQN